jgi:hypothetical protein
MVGSGGRALDRSRFGKLLQKYANSVSLVAVRDDYVFDKDMYILWHDHIKMSG